MWKQILYFFVLFLILSLGFVGFISNTGNSSAQFGIGVIIAALYVLWGIAYHSYRGDLHVKVVIEYTLIGIIAIVLLFVMI